LILAFVVAGAFCVTVVLGVCLSFAK